MRSSAVRLLRIKPIPAAQVQGPLRLPPSQSAPAAAAASASSPSASARSSSASESTVMSSLLERRAQALEAGQAFPENLRLEEHVHKKQLFWKVPREQREKLAKELKEA